MATQTKGSPLTRKQLVEVIQTGRGRRGVGKMRALAMLRDRKRKDAGDVMMEVVASRRENPRFRQMAAMGLYELGGDRADEALAKAAQHVDPGLAGTVAMGLGRVGSADRLAMVEELGRVAEGHARERVDFSASLLAYRHGLDGHEVRFPTKRQLQELGRRKANDIKIGKATAAEAELAAAAIKAQPLDVPVSTANALSIQCEPNTFVWLWAGKVARSGLIDGAERKRVAAVMFRLSRFAKQYALSALVLATPARGEVRLTVHRADSGAVLYAGTVADDGSLRLSARSRPGVAAVDVQARLTAARAEVVKARSAAIALEARAPKTG